MNELGYLLKEMEIMIERYSGKVYVTLSKAAQHKVESASLLIEIADDILYESVDGRTEQ